MTVNYSRLNYISYIFSQTELTPSHNDVFALRKVEALDPLVDSEHRLVSLQPWLGDAVGIDLVWPVFVRRRL